MLTGIKFNIKHALYKAKEVFTCGEDETNPFIKENDELKSEVAYKTQLIDSLERDLKKLRDAAKEDKTSNSIFSKDELIIIEARLSASKKFKSIATLLGKDEEKVQKISDTLLQKIKDLLK